MALLSKIELSDTLKLSISHKLMKLRNTMTVNKIPPMRSTSRQKRASTALCPLALMLALSTNRSVAAFTQCATVGKTHETITRREYRQGEDIFSSFGDTKTSGLVQKQNISNDQENPMPSWLRHRCGHLAEEKLEELFQSMIRTYLSEKEATKVRKAVRNASRGDPDKMAGAAEFLLILVEIMEMTSDVLIAAAFHYSTCVTARERSALFSRFSPSSITPDSVFWEDHYDQYSMGLDQYGSDVVKIARDSAKLKKTETVADSVVLLGGKSTRRSNSDLENLKNLYLSEMRDWRALAIRSAACLYRLKGLVTSRKKNATVQDLTSEEIQTTREALYIYAPLASKMGMHRLKSELEEYAFRILYHRQYNKILNIMKIFEKDHEELKTVRNTINQKVRQILFNDEIFMDYVHTKDVNVSSRLKEPYSLWRKMMKYGIKDLKHIPDLLASRVTLDAKKSSKNEDPLVTQARSKAMCYYVQKLLSDCFEECPTPEMYRLKDYIKTPKRNGYQSIHFTAVARHGGENWPFELQVRTSQMHQIAEYGLAAHWDYKANSSCQSSHEKHDYQRGIDSTQTTLMESMKEWHWEQHLLNPQYLSSFLLEPGAIFNPAYSIPKSTTILNEERNKIRKERVRSQAERIAPYIQALATEKCNLAEKHVFVFLSSSQASNSSLESKIISLPAGACVIDAVRQAEDKYGMKLSTFEWNELAHNGNSVKSITKRLKNGDILTVPVGFVEEDVIFSTQQPL